MSASSGITVSDDLASHFSSTLSSDTTRFVKISIKNESLVHDQSFPIEGHFNADLLKLQDREVLQDDIPAYVLARLDDPPSEWLAIFYVPDSARIRDKMLYASTRNPLLKALGSTIFTDSLFATSKEDLTPEAYAAHKRHSAAPKPLSAREQELADIREAEGISVLHQGTMARVSHLNTGIGFRWSKDAEDAVVSLGRGEGCAIAIIQVEPANEVLTLTLFKDTIVENYAESFPRSEPCYAFLAWPHSLTSPPRREICKTYEIS
jgi:twinfilin-like protein